MANIWGSYVVGLAAWFYIIYEIFAGEASKISKNKGTKASKKAFNALRIVVTLLVGLFILLVIS